MSRLYEIVRESKLNPDTGNYVMSLRAAPIAGTLVRVAARTGSNFAGGYSGYVQVVDGKPVAFLNEEDVIEVAD